MFGKIFTGLKAIGKTIFRHREIIAAVVPGGPIVKNAIKAVDVLIDRNYDPGTEASRRATAVRWARNEDRDLFADYTDEEMHVIIQMEFMRKKYPQLFLEEK